MLCSLARWHLSGALDRQGKSSRWRDAHLARCAGCREFARKLESLHGRLAATARSAPRPPPWPARRRWVRPALASGALALAAGAALYLLVPRAQPAPDGAAPVAVAPEASGVDRAPAQPHRPQAIDIDPDRQATDSAERDVLERLGVLFTEPPRLRAEMHALASDGRRGALAILGLGGVGPGERVR